MPIRDSSA